MVGASLRSRVQGRETVMSNTEAVMGDESGNTDSGIEGLWGSKR